MIQENLMQNIRHVMIGSMRSLIKIFSDKMPRTTETTNSNEMPNCCSHDKKH